MKRLWNARMYMGSINGAWGVEMLGERNKRLRVGAGMPAKMLCFIFRRLDDHE